MGSVANIAILLLNFFFFQKHLATKLAIFKIYLTAFNLPWATSPENYLATLDVSVFLKKGHVETQRSREHKRMLWTLNSSLLQRNPLPHRCLPYMWGLKPDLALRERRPSSNSIKRDGLYVWIDSEEELKKWGTIPSFGMCFFLFVFVFCFFKKAYSTHNKHALKCTWITQIKANYKCTKICI